MAKAAVMIGLPTSRLGLKFHPKFLALLGSCSLPFFVTKHVTLKSMILVKKMKLAT